VLLKMVKTATHITEVVEDDLLEKWIKTGRRHAEAFQKRAYITQVLELSLDTWPSMPFEIPRPPLQQVDSIKYYDVDDVEYTLDLNTIIQVDTASDPGRIGLKNLQTLPTTTLRSMAAVKIRFTAGYGSAETDIPEDVQDAIMLYVTWRNENRAAEDSLPEHVKNLLRPNRV
ncbi:hypothetical protein GWO25_02115, partial [Candidatus Saccharibacteria bacterium]|nr:hypothetical protein [Candidatus Saccharibacteria bacterium]